MEKPESLAPVSGLSAESPGGVPRAVPGGVRGIQTDTGVALFRSPGSLLHSGNPVVRSPGPIQPSDGPGTLNSGPGPKCSTSPGTGTGATKTSTPGPEETKVYNSESSTHSGSSFTERPRSILKNSSSILIKKPPSSEKKSQRWDEMNILATYHPADKDYGFMKADEPRTPYHRLQDTDEDPSAESSLKVTPESVAERFATMDNFLPKVLQYGDNKSSKTTDNFAKTYSSDFDKHRKIHYSEGKFLKTPKNLPLATEEDSSGASASISSSNQDSATCRNQFPSASDCTVGELANLQRKEYYSKGRYLRSCSHPELGEDIEDEEQDRLSRHNPDSGAPGEGTISLGLALTKLPPPSLPVPIKPVHQPQTVEEALNIPELSAYIIETGTGDALRDGGPLQPSISQQLHALLFDSSLPPPTLVSTMSSTVNGSQASNCLTKGLRCRSPGSSEKEHGSNQNQNPPSWNGRRHESLRLQWTQEKEPRPWKM